MGMDITMNEPPTPAEVRKAGLDKDQPDYFRFNWGGMHVMVMAGVVTEDDPAPTLPAWPPKGIPPDRKDLFEEAYGNPKLEVKLTSAERIVLRATRAQFKKVLATRSAQRGKVPAYKFLSNEGWIVGADECTAIATQLRAYSRRATEGDLDALGKAYADAQRVITAPAEARGEVVILGKEALGMSLEEYRTWLLEWAAYNAVAAKHGGYRVE